MAIASNERAIADLSPFGYHLAKLDLHPELS